MSGFRPIDSSMTSHRGVTFVISGFLQKRAGMLWDGAPQRLRGFQPEVLNLFIAQRSPSRLQSSRLL